MTGRVKDLVIGLWEGWWQVQRTNPLDARSQFDPVAAGHVPWDSCHQAFAER